MRRLLLAVLAIGLAAPAALGAVSFENVDLGLTPPAYVPLGQWVLVQRIAADGAAEVTKLRVFNQAAGTKVEGEDVERIEVRRASDGEVLKTVTSSSTLSKLATDGVSIAISQDNDFDGPFELEIWMKLKTTATLGTKLKLGGTKVTYNPEEDVDYAGAPAEDFEVGPSPAFAFDGSVPDGDVYPGQRFLAGRIQVDSTALSFDVEVAQLVVYNDADGTRLAGEYIQGIEIRRASDGVLLGQATTEEIAELTTGGTTITTGSSDTIPAYSAVGLEVWVTLQEDVPIGQELRIAGDITCGSAEFNVGDNLPAGDVAPVFQVGQPEGLEDITNLALPGGRVYSSQRFVAQRINLVDDDPDPFDVTVESLVVQNVADGGAGLADSQIASIELLRARDGAPMGQVTDATGLGGGGVRIPVTQNAGVSDDTAEIVELWVTLGEEVPHDRGVMLQSTVWHREDTKEFGLPHAGVDSSEFRTGPAAEEGFEIVAVADLEDRNVFQGVRFRAQRVELGDDDLDPYDVVVTSLMVRNAAADKRLADQYVSRLEVVRSDGETVGEVRDPVGLSLAGVRIPLTTGRTVLDDGELELDIYVTLKLVIPADRKLRLESTVWHSEGTSTFETAPLLGPSTITTELGDPPTGVNFSWSPPAPTFEDEITFTPAGGIADPEGDIADADFDWKFGDGATAHTDGPAAVTHKYGAGGTFPVTLTVTGEEGIPASKRIDVVVEGPPNDPPVIDEITTDPTDPDVGEDVGFAVTVTDPDQPEDTPFVYAWDFGDEGTSTLATPTHAYEEAGEYTVEVTVTDDRGATAEETIEIVVGNDPPTVGSLAANPANPSTGDEVEFTAVNVSDPDGDTIAHYEWDFGDGTTKDLGQRVERHVYTTPAPYTISVVAVDSRGAKSAEKKVSVTVTGPARTVMLAYPNPAETVVTFSYFLAEGATDPILRVYNLAGELVVERELPAGGTAVQWDLTAEDGTQLPNGLYFCVVTATGAKPSDVFRLLIVR